MHTITNNQLYLEERKLFYLHLEYIFMHLIHYLADVDLQLLLRNQVNAYFQYITF